MKKKYITTSLPYVNADPHIGFALEIVQADVLARFWRMRGYDVFFNTGTDEHGLKIYKKAQEEGKDPQKYVDEYAVKFEKLKDALNLSYTNFIRTTSISHKKAAQEFWKRCKDNGFIDKKMYKIKYCVGCELEKTESELIENHCTIHPNLELEIIEEENYFFKFSAFGKKLLELYNRNPEFVIPDFRFKEIRNFVASGLEDFSISRLKNKMPWGVAVPDDNNHIMYVWFDALVNYISALGWPDDEKHFEDYWSDSIQIAGKDNLRQQSAMWQAMLMAAGLSNTKQVLIHGFITLGGQKISKSLGNVIDPYGLVKRYGTDALRYYLLAEIPPFDDGDFSESRMHEIYQSDLSNELGNLLLRVTTIAEKDGLEVKSKAAFYCSDAERALERYEFNKALEVIWEEIKKLNKELDEVAPWKKSTEERKDFITEAVNRLKSIGHMLSPFLPETSEKISKACSGKIKKAEALFPKL